MRDKISDSVAEKIFSILVKEAGASPLSLDEFRGFCQTDISEFRFQGDLGFGGKFWVAHKSLSKGGFCPYYVNCYLEDMTDKKKLTIIEKVNAALAKLWKDLGETSGD